MGIEIIEKYFTLTPRQQSQMEALSRLYPEWNEKSTWYHAKISTIFTSTTYFTRWV